MFTKNKLAVVFAEFLGTATLCLAIIGASRYFNFTAPWYIGLAAAITLATIVTTIGKVSGAHVNPAITLGLWTLKKIPTTDAIVYFAAQLFGGAAALAFVEYVTNFDILAAGSASFDGRVFVAEMVGTAIFGFGVAAVIMQKIEGMQAAFGIGASLMVGVLVAAMAAPGFLNPAVALANNSWDITVVIAPLLGSVVGMNLYAYLLAPVANKPVSRVKVSSRK